MDKETIIPMVLLYLFLSTIIFTPIVLEDFLFILFEDESVATWKLIGLWLIAPVILIIKTIKVLLVDVPYLLFIRPIKNIINRMKGLD